MSADILIESGLWRGTGFGELAERVVETALSRLEIDGNVAILACDDARIAALNAEFRGRPVPTNVLSWPSRNRAAEADGEFPERPGPGDEELGDIAIAYETCAREARDEGKTLDAHAAHLVVHGLLHCLGYDHGRDGDAALMERIEKEILADLGISKL